MAQTERSGAVARLADAWDQSVEEHARRLQQIHVRGELHPGVLAVEIAYLEAHVAVEAARRKRRLTFWLVAATWALAIVTGALAIWG